MLLLQSRQLVNAEAIITEMVLQHALRMRLIPEMPKQEMPDTSGSGMTTPSSASANISSMAKDQTPSVHSNSETQSSGTTLQEDLPPSAPPSVQSNSETTPSGDQSSATTLQEDPSPSARPHVNNLVTTDVANITTSFPAFRLVIQIPVQVVICVVFLYMVLGWR